MFSEPMIKIPEEKPVKGFIFSKAVDFQTVALIRTNFF